MHTALQVIAGDGLQLGLAEVEASPTAPGPTSRSVLSAAGGLPLVLTLDLAADVAEATAAWSPADTWAHATVADVTLDLGLVGLSVLPPLLEVGTPGGAITAATSCPGAGPASAALSDLGALRLAVLGVEVDVPLAAEPGGTQLVVPLGVATATATVGLVTTSTEAGRSAEAALALTLRVEIRPILLPAIELDLTVDLASARCAVTVPWPPDASPARH